MVEDNEEMFSGKNYFEIQMMTSNSEYIFELKTSDGSVLCQGKGQHHECSAFNNLSHSVTLNVIWKGYVYDTTLITIPFTKLNGHTVTVIVRDPVSSEF